MKKSIWISTALAAAAMAVAGPATAVSSATATITGFSITLYDLNVGGVITDGLTFTYEQSGSQAEVYSSSESSPYAPNWVAGNFMPTSATAMLTFGEASASTDTSSANASGSVSGPGYGGSGSFNAYAYGVDSGFTLTPWTGMKLTVTFEGTASTGPSLSGYTESANANGQVSVSINDDNGYEYHSANRQAYASCGTWGGMACSGESNSFSGTFSVSYANFSDNAVEGYMYASASAYGQSSVPVPEPQTYLMLLAGLAGVGAVVRRRRAA